MTQAQIDEMVARLAKRMESNPDDMQGVQYVVTGGSGSSFDDFMSPAQPYSLVRERRYHYVRFAVDGWSMSATVIDRDGQTFDSFTIPNAAANQIATASASRLLRG